MSIEQEILEVINQIPAAIEKAFMEALVLRHPGHANQKVHGNRYGAGQAKESLRRLKEDKGAREQYKATARKKQGLEAKPKRTPGRMNPKTTYGEVQFSKPASYSGRKRITVKREGKTNGEWAGSIGLELRETGKGTNLYNIENPLIREDTGYGGKVQELLIGGQSLKEAKKISKIILENTEFNKPTWEGTPEFKSKKVRQALRDAGYPVRVD